MSIETILSSIYKNFFDDELLKIKVQPRCYEGDSRYYAYITNSNNKQVILKAYNNSYNSACQVNKYAYLSQKYKENGLNVPLFYKTKEGNYFTNFTFENESYLAWCEEFLPYDTLETYYANKTNVTSEFYYIIGSFVGKMHAASATNKISVPWNSALVLFESFCEEDEFDENYESALDFYETLQQYGVDIDILNKIWTIYNQKRNEIKAIYPMLPSGMVQGDLSPNNVLIDPENKPCGIIDFNQSGNNIFVTEMMQWCIYLNFICFSDYMPYSIDNLKSYFNGYKENYSLNENELSCINNLYNILRPFHFCEVSELINIAKEGNTTEVEKRLKCMHFELTRDDIIDFIKADT